MVVPIQPRPSPRLAATSAHRRSGAHPLHADGRGDIRVFQCLADRDAERGLRGDRSLEAIAGPGRIHRFHALAGNGEGPALRPGHRSATAECHDDALPVSRLQRARDFHDARIRIVRANLRADDCRELGLVENEDIDEVEQTTPERHRRRRIEDGHGAGRSRPGEESAGGRDGNLELTDRHVAFRQRRLGHVTVRQQGIGAGNDDDRVVSIRDGNDGRTGASLRRVAQKF